ncbi:MAG: haloacid dehalogenase type II [Thermoleophilia bacterium]
MSAAPKALFFDVFGTCVDWRTGVAREVAALASRMGRADIDPDAVADAWRARYQPQMETVRSGARPWVNLDVLHRESLDEVLAEAGFDEAPAEARDELTLAWHRLDPWPDTIDGLTRLKALAVIAPHSNGHVALLLQMARRARLPWDLILGSETAGAYKPEPRSYLRNAELVGVPPGDVMMVAAHNGDLHAAAAVGMRTAFVRRPTEHGPGQTTDLAPDGAWDVVADDLLDLADQLGA